MAHDTPRDDTPISFKDTLNLPHTDFPIRPNAKVDDPELLERWKQEKLYDRAMVLNQGAAKYILHDGPPYANGNIHLGHAYNKILKDIVTKSRRMAGFQVPVTPGWDCHGLPIEFKVSQENPGATPVQLKQACRKYAHGWIDIQREEFKQLGVIMDWDNPYITMDPGYESKTVQAFGKFVGQKFIERKNKTVPWCATCQTVLASAEIEHKDRKDPSIYVLFELEKPIAQKLFNLDAPVYVMVWTTTPWTLPLNRAVMVKPNAHYQLLELKGKYVIVGAQLADKIASLVGEEKKVIKTFAAEELRDAQVYNPVVEDFSVPLIFDESVGIDEGTAFVHCAPGCGPIDYEIGVKNHLEIFSPISPKGTYTDKIRPLELVDMPVADGQIWVIKKLAERGSLFFKTTINHSYPHCWRCRNGLILRATLQWFFNLNQHNVKQLALETIEKINFIPEQSKNFLRATVESRWEWCLSRQRVWGIPIPALLCMRCDYAYITPEFIEKVAEHIKKEGIEYWDRVTLNEILPPDLVCPHCGVAEFKKETDILDVWFDSGISHYAVLYDNPKLAFPADIYLEGIDQHRGWFQSSLLTSIVLEQEACTKTIMTHGYTVDAKGQKMSKSLGNVIAPQQIIDQMGTDGLRLWVASIGNNADVVVSDVLLRNVSEVYRKIRNTCRFLLQNLYDYDHARDAVAWDMLSEIDRYALTQLYILNNKLIEQYLQGDFTAIFHGLADYCSVELSSFYLDIVKDRLYTEKADGQLRRAAQTTLWYILDTLTRLMAPLLSFTAERISDNYQKDKTASIHLQSFATLNEIGKKLTDKTEIGFLGQLPPDMGSIHKTIQAIEQQSGVVKLERTWELLKTIRTVILKAIEVQREQGLIKHSLEARVRIFVDNSMPDYDLIKKFLHEDFFKEFLIVSQVLFAQSSEGLQQTSLPGVYVLVDHAAGTKCPRCWQWDVTTHEHGLCRRCMKIVG